ncbi:Uncharacterised protein [Burkholderia pseudomallei]|nr:Uncharacterised protein [Burkholderia pseudomallei]
MGAAPHVRGLRAAASGRDRRTEATHARSDRRRAAVGRAGGGFRGRAARRRRACRIRHAADDRALRRGVARDRRRAPRSRARGARAARQGHLVPSGRAARRRRVRADDGRGRRDHTRMPSAARAADSVRHRHVVRGAHRRAARRRMHRSVRHEPDSARERRGSRLHGRGGGDAQAAQCAPARHGALLSDRPGRGRVDRRHVLDARVRHERGALRDDARERARARSRAAERRRRLGRLACAQVGGGLRSRAPVRRRGRHARHDHGRHAAAASAPGPVIRRGVQFPGPEGRGRLGDRRHPQRRADRARRVARRTADRRVQPLCEAEPRRAADALFRVRGVRRGRRRADRLGRGDLRGLRRR